MARALLWCGILSSFLYVANDIAAVWLWPGYDHAAQAVSELTARGAPSRSSLAASAIVYDLLLIAFALGMWRSAGGPGLALAAMLIAQIGMMGLVTTGVFPMHLRGNPPGLSDKVHIGATALTVLSIVAAMAFAGASLGGRFRSWSLVAIVATLLFGALAGTQAPRIDAGLATPWLGLVERLSIGSYLLWVAFLSARLLRGPLPCRKRPPVA